MGLGEYEVLLYMAVLTKALIAPRWLTRQQEDVGCYCGVYPRIKGGCSC